MTTSLCTWFVAACMSVACEKDQHNPMTLSGRRRRTVAKRAAVCGGAARLPGILMTSSDPCGNEYNNNGWGGSDFLVGRFGSGFGSGAGQVGRRRRNRQSGHLGSLVFLIFDNPFCVFAVCLMYLWIVNELLFCLIKD